MICPNCSQETEVVNLGGKQYCNRCGREILSGGQTPAESQLSGQISQTPSQEESSLQHLDQPEESAPEQQPSFNAPKSEDDLTKINQNTPAYDGPPDIGEKASFQPDIGAQKGQPVSEEGVTPVAQNLDQHPAAAVAAPTGSRGKKIVIATVGLLVALGVSFGGISFVKGDMYWARDLAGFGVPKNPKSAVEKAFRNLDSQKSSSQKITGEVEVSGDSTAPISLSAQISGDEDRANSKSQANIKIKMADQETEMDVIVDGDKVFAKSSQLFGSGEWISNEEEIKGIGSKLGVGGGLVSGDLSGKLQTNRSSALKYIKSVKKAGEEKVAGVPSYHYVSEIDLGSLLDESVGNGGGVLSNPLVASFLDGVSVKADFYVEKKRIILNKAVITFETKTELINAKGTLAFAFSNFGADFNIKAPEVKTDDGQTQTQEQKRDAVRKTDFAKIKEALAKYKEANGQYPVLTDDSKDGSFMKVLLDGKYISVVPLDPLHPQYYYKYVSADGTRFELTGVLEDQNDPTGTKTGSFNVYKITN